MVMQPAMDFLVGGSNPGSVNMPPPPPPQRVHRPGLEPPPTVASVCCVTIRPAVKCYHIASPLLGAF